MVYNAIDPVYFCGDLHGNFQWLKPYFEKYDISNCSVIFCGDVGLGFKKLPEWYAWVHKIGLKKFLKTRNIGLYFIRGNHDDPSWFDDKYLVTKTFKAVSDYSIISTPTHNILCVGGGISLDRSDRILQTKFSISQYMKYHPSSPLIEAEKSVTQIYWKDEAPVYNEQALQSLTKQIDTICSHVAPTFLPPSSGPNKDWFRVDPTLAMDCAAERQVMDSVYNKLMECQHNVRNWYYGHYHYYCTQISENLTGNLLDMARDGNLCIKNLS